MNSTERHQQEAAQLNRIETQTKRSRTFVGSEGYTTRELDLIFQDIKDQLNRFEAQTNTSLMEIKAQVTKTNGSVINLKVWRGYLTGAVAVIIIIGLPIMGYLALQVVSKP